MHDLLTSISIATYLSFLVGYPSPTRLLFFYNPDIPRSYPMRLGRMKLIYIRLG